MGARKKKSIWQKIKGEEGSEQRSFVRYAAIVTGLFLIFMLVKTDSIIDWIGARITLSRQQKQIENLMQENETMDAKIRSLRENKDSLETFAREEFFFSTPDEDVYIVE